MITRETVRNQILSFLNHQITLATLVDWAEDAVFEGDLQENDTDLLMEILGRLGVADVPDFALTWEDYFSMLSTLGYHPQVVAA